MAVFFFSHFGLCLLKLAFVGSISTFLEGTPGHEWKIVGYLDMTDPTQKCPDSWQMITSPRSSCGKKSSSPCDSLNISTSGAKYQKVCGRFRGYQIGSPDAFRKINNAIVTNIETYYVDGVTVTYGSPGNRHHVYTYAVGIREVSVSLSCPCAGGSAPPQFVGSDYYCESGNPELTWNATEYYSFDVLWDRQQCGGNEVTCCSSTDLPWFCQTFPTPISEDLEVRICTDQGLNDENVGIESYELYIQAVIPLMNIQAATVLNLDNTVHQLEIIWIPVIGNVALYTVKVVGADGSVKQGCTVCTTSPCFYVHQVTHVTNNYSIFVTSIKGDGTQGSHNDTTINDPTNSVFQNGSFLNFNNSISCLFLNNQSFYCVACCSTDPSVPPHSSMYSISPTSGTEVSVPLQSLTKGQMYYCKAAASISNSTNCTGPVVGGVKMYFTFMASLTPVSPPTTVTNAKDMYEFSASVNMGTIIGITIVISIVFLSLGILVVACICYAMKTKSTIASHHSVQEPVHEMIGTMKSRNPRNVMEDNAETRAVNRKCINA